MKQGHGRFSATEKITYTALLVAMQVILGNVLQIPMPIKQFNFGFLPVAFAGCFLGVLPAMLVGALGDFFGAHLFPVGAYFFGFTVTYAAVGLIYGLALYQKNASWPRVAAACLLAAVCNLFLNSYWLTYFIPRGYWALVGARSLAYLIDVPVSFVVIWFTLKGANRVNLPLFHMGAGTQKQSGVKGSPS